MAIHAAITRKVKPGNERAFEESIRECFQESLDCDGVLGVHLLSPLRTSVKETSFYRSDLFKRWEQRVTQLTEGERNYRELHGLEAWFRTPESPPQWKM